MEIEIGAAKVNKYASSESGDTLEVIERPGGGLSIVLADGQRSGKSAKLVSNMVVRKVISLLAEGVRDGAAARAASDYLFAQKQGKVQSTLNIISIDLSSNTVVIARNNPAAVYCASPDGIRLLDEESTPVGLYRNTKPVIQEVPIQTGLCVVAFTDGISHAGERTGQKLEIGELISSAVDGNRSAQEISDTLLEAAMGLDQQRPIDDISVVSIRVQPRTPSDSIRRLTIRLPVAS